MVDLIHFIYLYTPTKCEFSVVRWDNSIARDNLKKNLVFDGWEYMRTYRNQEKSEIQLQIITLVHTVYSSNPTGNTYIL